MPDFNMIKIRRAINLVICFVFVIVLSLPFVLQITGIQFDNSTSENSKKMKFPVLNLTTNKMFLTDFSLFTNQFNTYYTDNFVVRKMMIQLYIYVKVNLFYTSPIPEKIVIGKEDWLFLGDGYSKAITETKGITNFSEEELNKITNNIIEFEKYFKQKQIKFFLAIAPEKSTVYGDNLPIKQSSKQTKLEQLRKRLSAIGFNLIDLKADLKKDQSYPLYYKTDSHWNQIGMYYGYLRLMKSICPSFPMVKILQFDNFSIDSSNRNYTGDMAWQLSLKTKEPRFNLTSLIKKERVKLPNKYKRPSSYVYNPESYERRYENMNGKLKVLIFHDSFFQEMQKFIAESFQNTVFIWSTMDKGIIEKEKPDIVIREMVEREIDQLKYPLK